MFRFSIKTILFNPSNMDIGDLKLSGNAAPAQQNGAPDSQSYDRIVLKKSGRVIMRKKKRKTKEGEIKILSREEILAMIEKIPIAQGTFEMKGLMYRALVALLYLTGARINELLTIKKDQFEFMEDKATGIKYLVINNIPTLKRGEKIYRPQFLRKDFEEPFIKHVLAWRKELHEPDALLFPLTDARAYQIVKQYTGMYNHYFRHVRNTDLVRYYGFNTHYLKQWNGWKDGKSGEFYVNLIGEDLKQRILQTDALARSSSSPEEYHDDESDEESRSEGDVLLPDVELPLGKEDESKVPNNANTQQGEHKPEPV